MKQYSIIITAGQKEDFDNALSDFLCWIGGFKAGGGNYMPGSECDLMNLRDAICRAMPVHDPEICQPEGSK